VAALGWLTTAQAVLAQNGPSSPEAADITLTKTVEIFSYEDLTFTIDAYTVRPGDNLASVLKGQGLWPSRPDQSREAQLMRLVSELNPAIANLDLIASGQTLFLPSARGLEEPPPEPAPARPEPALGPGMVAYALDVAPNDDKDAQPAAATPSPTPTPIKPGQRPSAEDGTYELSADVPPEPKAASEPRRAAASGNDGPLETAPDGTVFRTVKVKPGDTIERLLRREGLDRNLIYRGLIKLTAELNPDLKDPNVIIVGAELRIPSDGQWLTAYGGPAPAGSPARDATGRRAEARSRAPAAGDKYSTPTKRLPPAALPTADSQSAKAVLNLIFTRLGEKITAKGRIFLPLDEPPHFDVEAASTPVVELTNGRKVVLDVGQSLSADLVKRFTEKYREYVVFQSTKREPLDKALARLWAMCGYYRVYDHSQAFEGGRDVRLKISADWLIWPTADAWNRGQPTVVNLAPAADNGTPAVWVKFLAEHGIKVIDLYQGRTLASPGKSPTPVNNFTVIDIEGDNPSAFAASLVRSFGYSPRLGVKVELERGRVVTGGAEIAQGVAPPVFWESGQSRHILEYGDLSTEDLQILRKNEFNVISSAKDVESVLKSILAALNIRLGQNLVLNGNSSGGPSITLTIAGQSFVYNGRSYLFSSVVLPNDMVSLDPNQNVVVLRHKASSATSTPPAREVADQSAQAADPEPDAITVEDLP
jgi:hypothetical protein